MLCTGKVDRLTSGKALRERSVSMRSVLVNVACPCKKGKCGKTLGVLRDEDGNLIVIITEDGNVINEAVFLTPRGAFKVIAALLEGYPEIIDAVEKAELMKN